MLNLLFAARRTRIRPWHLLALLATLLLQRSTVYAQTPVEAGFRDFSFGAGANTTPTGEKPMSKLWWNDGSWWGSLFNPSAGVYRIYEFHPDTQSWTDTGTTLDTRSGAKADALWDQASQHLYIVSAPFSISGTSAGSSPNWGKLFRYSYNLSTRTYALDPGFPVDVSRGKAETITVAKDFAGRLWVTYVEDGKVKINWSTTSESTWGTPITLPVSPATTATVSNDDISDVIAFPNGDIGVAWSNQSSVDNRSTHFAVHRAADPPTTWQTVETVIPDGNVCASGTSCADDHLNMKADSTGRIWMVIKTSLDTLTEPQIILAVRSLTGVWSTYVVALGSTGWTRPIVLLDEQHSKVYVFATSPTSGGTIYMKSSSMDDISFPAGIGVPFIQSSIDLEINNATSGKQNVNSNTGMLVLASEQNTLTYLHNFSWLGGGPPVPPATPVTLLAEAVSPGQVTLTWTDMSDNEVSFEIERSTGGGAFTLIANANAEAQTFHDLTVNPVTTYTYRIRAVNLAGQSAYSNSASATTPAPAGAGDIKVISFESGTLTDPATGVDNVNGTVTLQTAPPLKDVYSARIADAPSSYLEEDFPATPSLYMSFYIKLNALPAADVQLARLLNGGTVGGNLLLRTNGQLRLRDNATTVGLDSVPLQVGEVYRIGLRQTAGTGANAILEAFVAAGDTEFGVPFAQTSSGLATLPANRIRLGTYTAVAADLVIDDVKLDDTAMPGPSLPTPPAPAAPADLAATAPQGTTVELTWTDASTTETAFHIERALGNGTFAEIAAVGPNTTSFTDATVAEATSYTYRVRAVNAGGFSPYSNVAAVTTPQSPPAAPTALAAAAAQDALQPSVILTWVDNSAAEASFSIERAGSNGVFVEIDTVGANATGYLDLAVSPDTQYSYRVRALNAVGYSEYSNVAAVTTPPPPAPPAAPTLTATSTAFEVHLMWNDTASNETAYVLERAGADGVFAEIGVAAPDTTIYDDGTVLPASAYSYRVRALNVAGYSAYSNVATVLTPPEPVIPPAPVLGGAATASTEVQLMWNDATSIETSFSIERAGTNGIFAVIGTVAANITTYTDSTVAGGAQYSYQVRAVTPSAASDYSNTVTVTTPSATAAASSLKVMTFENASVTDPETGADSKSGTVTIETAAPIKGAQSARIQTSSSYLQENFTATSDFYVTFYLRLNAIPSSARILLIQNGSSTAGNLYVLSGGKLRLRFGSTTIGETGNILTTNTVYRIMVHQRQAAGGETRVLEAFVANGDDAFTTPFASTTTTTWSGSASRVRIGNTSGTANAVYDNVQLDSGLSMPTSAPSAPADLAAAAGSEAAVFLTWTDTSMTESGVKVERSENGGAFGEIASLAAGVTSFIDASVQAETAYSYRVKAINAAGDSPYSNVADVTTPAAPVAPADPSDLTAAAATGQIVLNWTVNAIDDTAQHIERAQDAGPFVEIATAPAGVTTFTDATVAAETTYSYRVRASNGGGFSGYTNVAMATTPAVPPTGPTDLTGLASSHTTIQVTWVDASQNETGFRVERAGTNGLYAEIAQLGANVTSFSDAGLNPQTQYSYRVRAVNAVGFSAFSNVATVTTQAPPVPPPAPTGLTAAATTSTSIALSWNDPGATETSFHIERAGGDGVFTEIATVAANVTSYTDTALTPSTLYSFRVRGHNEAGFGLFSAVASATTPAPPVPPGTPAGLTASASGTTQIQLTWTDMSVTEIGFSIERADAGGGFVEVGTAGTDVTSFLDVALTPSTEYSYRIRALTAQAASSYSNVATVTTPSAAPATQVIKNMTFENASLTDAITGADSRSGSVVFESVTPIHGVRSAKVTSSSQYLTEDFTGVNDFTVTFYFRMNALPSSDSRFIQVFAGSTAVATLMVQRDGTLQLRQNSTAIAPNSTALTVGTVYRINVHQRQAAGGATSLLEAFVAAGDDPFTGPFASSATANWNGAATRLRIGNTSGSVQAVFDDVKLEGETPAAVTAPTTPTGLNALALSSTAVQLSWNDNAINEVETRIERADSGGEFAEIAALGADVTTFIDTGVTPASSYSYRLRVSNAAGNSGYSNSASVTTPDTPPGPEAPADLAFTLALGSVTLTWTDASADETGFFVERAGGDGVFSQIGIVGSDVTTYIDATVEQDTAYSYRVRAANGSYSEYSNTVSLITLGAPPLAPTGLTAIAPTSSAVELSWTDASTTETSFRIERAGTDGVFAEIATVAANVATFSDTTVAEQTFYSYRVRALKNTTFSDYSNVAAVTTPQGPPQAPANLGAASVVSTVVELTWTDASSSETGFRVERTEDGEVFDEIAQLPANTTSFNDTTVQPATAYAYRARAENAVGFSAYTDLAQVTTPVAPPAAPTAIVATATTATSVALSWTDASTTEEAFLIERSSGGGAFVEIATAGTNVISFVDDTVAAETAYTYRVRASNAGGLSAYSPEITIVTLPPAPTGVSAMPATGNSVQVTWTDTSSTETTFRIERSSGGGPFVEIDTTPANSTAYTDTTVSPDTTYSYRVRAAAPQGMSAYSESAGLTTGTSAPTGLTATASGSNLVQLAWSDTSALETGFHIERSVGGGPFEEIATVAANVVAYSDTTVVENTAYSYRVRALSLQGFSGYSENADVTTPVAAPAAPTALSASAPTSLGVQLTWTDSSGTETGFRIERSVAGGAFAEIGTVAADVTSFNDTAVTATTAYSYRVRAENASGLSDYSNTADVTTPVAAPDAPTDLAAAAPTISSVQLSWTDTAGEAGFRIERSVGGGVFVEIASVAANVIGYTDTNVTSETTYAYRVRGENAGGLSEYSAEAVVTIRAAAPGGLTAAAPTSAAVELSWTDNFTTETAFHIERAGTDGIFEEIGTVAADVTSFTDAAVSAETAYSYRVRVANPGGLSAYSAEVAVTTQPLAPGDLTATGQSTTTVLVSWTDRSTAETGFRIERAAGGGAFVEIATVGPDVTSYTDATAIADAVYAYRVRAASDTGFSAYSATADASTLAPAPGGLTATAVSGVEVQLSWTDNSSSETLVRIERAGTDGVFAEIATVAADITAYSDQTVSPTTQYSYRVRVTNPAGNSAYSNVATLTTPMAAPTDLTASSPSGDQVTLHWTDNSTNEDAFHIERSFDGGAFVEIAALGPNATSYTDGEVSSGNSYSYRVRANGAFGFSAYSNTVSLATLAAPDAPSGLTANAISGTDIQLSWTDNSTVETSVRVERAANGGPFVEIATLAADTTSYLDATASPSTPYQYRVRMGNSEGFSAYSNQANVTTLMATPGSVTGAAPTIAAVELTWTNLAAGATSVRVEKSVGGGAFAEIASLPSTASSFSDTAVAAESTYAYRLRAAGDSGFSAYSPAVNVMTPPPAPSALTASAPSSSGADLSWMDNSSTETGFRIERSEDGGPWTEVGTVAANVTAYTDNTTNELTSYSYRVKAENAGGLSAASNAADVTTPIAPPAAATGLVATVPGAGAVQLTWTDGSSSETAFHIERSTGGGAYTEIATVETDVTAFTDATVAAETEYSYRVRAANVGGFSGYSNVATITTTPAAPAGVVATALDHSSVQVSWTDTSSTEATFAIERSTAGGAFVEIGTVEANVTSFIDSTTSEVTSYTYRVRASNTVGSSSASADATVSTPLAAPTGLTAAAPNQSSVVLSWTDISNNETAFHIERAEDGGAFIPVGSIGTNATSYTDGTVVAETTYTYRVRAGDGTGFSIYSTTAVVTTPAPPAAPTGLTAVALDHATVQLSWTDTSTVETGFQIDRSVNGGAFSPLTTVPADTTSYTDTDVSPLTSYSYRVRASNAEGLSASSNQANVTTLMPTPTALAASASAISPIQLTWADNSPAETTYRVERSTSGGAFVEIASLPADSTSYSDSDVAADTVYSYRVRGMNGVPSAYSNVATITTRTQPPTGLTATAPSSTAVQLAWIDGSVTEISFRIERSVDGGAFVEIASVAPDTTSYTDDTTTELTTYSYRVRTENAGGFSAYSSQANVSTPIAAPGGPTTLTAVVSDGAVQLSWTDGTTTETGFRIERSSGGDFVEIGTVGADVTTWADTTVAAESEYSYRVRAENAGGVSGYSPTATAMTAPAAPAALVATATAHNSVELTWTDASAVETEIHVERSADGGAFIDIATLPASTTAYVDATVVEATAYLYRVRAANANGTSSASNTATVTTPVAPPFGLTAAAESGSAVSLSWTDGSGSETAVHIERAVGSGEFVEIATFGANVTTFTDGSVSQATTYSYRVRNAGAAGASTYSNVATVTTPGAPAAPTELTATVLGYNSVQLSWTDNADNEVTFRIERAAAGGAFAAVDTVDANVTTFTDTTALGSTSYSYRVRAINAEGNSAFTNQANVTTPMTPPLDVAAAASSTSAVQVTWTDATSNEAGFTIERSTAGGEFVALATLAANTTSYTDTAVAPETAYAYRLMAANAGESSVYSNVAAVTTPSTAPATLSATASSDTEVVLTWTDTAVTETAFHIERSTDGGPYVEIGTVAADTATFIDAATSEQTAYTYRVRANGPGGFSAYSNAASVTTPATAPTAPTDLTATSEVFSSVELSWTDTATIETGFSIERSADGGAFVEIATVAADVTTYSDTAVDGLTAYSYRVRAVRSGSFSEYSNVADATTPVAPPTAPTGVSATPLTGTSIQVSWTDTSSTEASFHVERAPLSGGAFVEVGTAAADATSFVDTTVTPESGYTYRVRARNSSGYSPYSNFGDATTPIAAPVAPSGVTATALSIAAVEVTWTDNSMTESSHVIERAAGAGAFAEIGTVAADVTAFTDSTVVADTIYSYRVRAINVGGQSPNSNVGTATTPAPAPTDAAATAPASGSVVVTWTDNASTETAFHVERAPAGGGAFTEIGTTGPNVATFTDTTIEPETAYTYRIRTANAGGFSAYSNLADVTATPLPPTDPTGLTATAATYTAIQLTWTDTSTSETGYRVERSTAGGPFIEIATLAADVSSYIDGTGAPETAYAYRVRAVNSGGFSAYSNEAAVTTPIAPPAAPTGLSAAAPESGTVNLSWTDAATTEDGFRIERSENGGPLWDPLESTCRHASLSIL